MLSAVTAHLLGGMVRTNQNPCSRVGRHACCMMSGVCCDQRYHVECSFLIALDHSALVKTFLCAAIWAVSAWSLEDMYLREITPIHDSILVKVLAVISGLWRNLRVWRCARSVQGKKPLSHALCSQSTHSYFVCATERDIMNACLEILNESLCRLHHSSCLAPLLSLCHGVDL